MRNPSLITAVRYGSWEVALTVMSSGFVKAVRTSLASLIHVGGLSNSRNVVPESEATNVSDPPSVITKPLVDSFSKERFCSGENAS